MTNPKSDQFHFAEMVRSTDRSFFEAFDPFAHFVVASAMQERTKGKIELTDTETGEEVVDASVLERLRASQDREESHISFAIRALRYFTSETLLLLLLNSAAKEPFARTTSLLNGRRSTPLFKEISQRKVPKGYEKPGSNVSFEDWLYLSAFRSFAQQGQTMHDEIVEMLVEEARLLSVRGAINAFKHGKSVSFGDGPVLKIQTNDGPSPVNIAIAGVNWVDWSEKPKEGEYTVGFGTEELNPEKDYQRILSCSLLLDSIKQVRLAELNGDQKIDVSLPNDIALGAVPKRQNFNFKISKESEK